ncbi:MAG TPA: alpha/beta hydrolase [Thermoplasmata archaeon]|nr:alpha/beta hydrolase [Thermoplasmata archaeon]
MGTVEVGGVSLFWAERGTGPPVVFVHGIPTDYRAWDAQTSAFSGDFRTVTYSRRYAYPNVRSGDLSDSTIQNNAADLAGLIQLLNLDPVHLVGHSYGGFIAAYLATRQPELLRSLTLVEPAIASLLLRDPKSREQAIGLLLRHPKVAYSASRFLRNSNDPALAAFRANDTIAAVRYNLNGVEDRPKVLEQLPEAIQKMMVDNGKTVKETDTPYPNLSRATLAEIRLPTLMIHGQTSALWLRAIAEMAGASIPRCRVVTIPNSGHYPHFQNPEAFNAALRKFLPRGDEKVGLSSST